MTRWQQRLRDAAQHRAAQAAQRTLYTVQRRAAARVWVDGRELIDFAGNDYLGLASDPRLAQALTDAAPRGVGASASHLVSGHHASHTALEQALARWLDAPRALLLGSGYAGNLAVLQGLLGRADHCVLDRLNHASLIDGARLAACTLHRYPHADAEAAERQLARISHHTSAADADPLAGTGCTPSGRLDVVSATPAPSSGRSLRGNGLAVLASDGVFSMDGDVAPLPALAAACARHEALFYVDEAHALGVLGEHGAGSVAAAGLGSAQVPLRLCTFGKALGCYGAALVGDGELIEHLQQTARPYIYTTALPPALAEVAHAAVLLAQGAQTERARLQAHIAHFRDAAAQLGLSLIPSMTPIQPLLIGDNARTVALADALRARGFWVGAIRPPTVPQGQARLRITLSAAHGTADIDALLAALADSHRGATHAH